MMSNVRRDTTLAVGAARALSLVLTDGWPMVAALLLAEGADGEALAALASLTRNASGWEVDQLLDEALTDADLPPVSIEDAGVVVARMLAQVLQGPQAADHPIVRALAM